MLLLTTTGRKSGQPRTTPLIFGRDGEDYLVVASHGRRPDASPVVPEPGGQPRSRRSRSVPSTRRHRPTPPRTRRSPAVEDHDRAVAELRRLPDPHRTVIPVSLRRCPSASLTTLTRRRTRTRLEVCEDAVSSTHSTACASWSWPSGSSCRWPAHCWRTGGPTWSTSSASRVTPTAVWPPRASGARPRRGQPLPGSGQPGEALHRARRPDARRGWPCCTDCSSRPTSS